MSKENLDSLNRKEQLQKDRPDFNRIKPSVETPESGAANAINSNEEEAKRTERVNEWLYKL
ncbi:MAG: hypothetical protein RCO49_01255 [Rickettsia endosymbiont of Argas persicus]